MNITAYKRSLRDTYDKVNIISMLSMVEGNVASMEASLYGTLGLVQFEKQEMQSNVISKSMYGRIALDALKGAGGKKLRKPIKAVASINDVVSESLPTVMDHINNNFPKTFVTESATVKDLSLLLLTEIYFFYSKYTNMLLVNIMKDYGRVYSDGEDVYDITKSDKKYLKENKRDYYNAVEFLMGAGKNPIKKLDNIPDIIVTDENEPLVNKVHSADISKSPIGFLRAGFTGNPIYHILKWSSDIIVSYTKRRREEVSQLEVLKISVKAEIENNPSEAARRELELIDDRIVLLNKKIREVEEDS